MLRAALLASAAALLIAAGEVSRAASLGGLGIAIENRGSTTVLQVIGEREITYSSHQLADPDRFVLVLEGIIRSYTPRRPIGTLVKAVRVAQVQLHPRPLLKVVVDLYEPTTPAIGNTGTGLEVIFHQRETPLVSTADTMFLNLEFSSLSSASGGGRVAVDWLRAAEGGLDYLAGISYARLADNDWAVGHFGAFSRIGDHLSWRGDLHLGTGNRADRSFDYQMVEAGLTWEIVDQRLYLDIEDRYLDIDTTHGNLLELGVTFLPRPRYASKLAYIRSTGGNTESDFVSGRLDIFAGRHRFLGGFAVGRTRPEAVATFGGDAAELEQVFVGMAVPISGPELTVVLDLLRLDEVERATLTLSLRLPRKRAAEKDKVQR